jgi:hypothetical protein
MVFEFNNQFNNYNQLHTIFTVQYLGIMIIISSLIWFEFFTNPFLAISIIKNIIK